MLINATEFSCILWIVYYNVNIFVSYKGNEDYVRNFNYEQAVEYILDVPKFTKKNPVDNIKALMEQLGNPQRDMKVIHVAGTNGKGSVCAFLGSIFDEAKKAYGMFTSPHLVEINERFRINQKNISNTLFTEVFNEVMEAIDVIVEKGFLHPSFFELLFAMGMVVFAKEKVEYAIVETGLGGRLDATNMIETPIATVITTIGLDHTEVLGDTIEKIAFEKAGIIKPYIPVIFDGSNEEASNVIENMARKNQCKFYKFVDADSLYNNCEEEFSYEMLEFNDKNIDFLYKYGYYGCIGVSLRMVADYQMKNASLAIKTIQVIDKEIEDALIQRGIQKTKWAGRMEMILPKVYLDGAHNENGITEFIKTVKHFKNGRKVLLFSAVKEKDYKKMIQDIGKEQQFSAVIVTAIHNKRMIPLEELQTEFEKNVDCKVIAIEDVKEAFDQTLKLKGQDGLAFCVGSLYLVGEITDIIRRLRYDKF